MAIFGLRRGAGAAVLKAGALNVLRLPQRPWAKRRAAWLGWGRVCAGLAFAVALAALTWHLHPPTPEGLHAQQARGRAQANPLAENNPIAKPPTDASSAMPTPAQLSQAARQQAHDWARQRQAQQRVHTALAPPHSGWRVLRWQSEGAAWTLHLWLPQLQGLPAVLQHLTDAGPAPWAVQQMQADAQGGWEVVLTAPVHWAASAAKRPNAMPPSTSTVPPQPFAPAQGASAPHAQTVQTAQTLHMGAAWAGVWAQLQQALQAQGLQVLSLQPKAGPQGMHDEQQVSMRLQGHWPDWLAFEQALEQAWGTPATAGADALPVASWVWSRWQVVAMPVAVHAAPSPLPGAVTLDVDWRWRWHAPAPVTATAPVPAPAPASAPWPGASGHTAHARPSAAPQLAAIWPAIAVRTPAPGPEVFAPPGHALATSASSASSARTGHASHSPPLSALQLPVAQLQLLGVWRQGAHGAFAVLGTRGEGALHAWVQSGQSVGQEGYRLRWRSASEVELFDPKGMGAPRRLSLQGDVQ